jgi:hypothetical protein
VGWSLHIYFTVIEGLTCYVRRLLLCAGGAGSLGFVKISHCMKLGVQDVGLCRTYESTSAL